ncbi:MAG: hypothetical protein H0Z24_08720 [Thermosipho sp. (in: Bacteria)]|nr:hypothetical protein [Thermosipho sp. (in: thermotogales)]
MKKLLVIALVVLLLANIDPYFDTSKEEYEKTARMMREYIQAEYQRQMQLEGQADLAKIIKQAKKLDKHGFAIRFFAIGLMKPRKVVVITKELGGDLKFRTEFALVDEEGKN